MLSRRDLVKMGGAACLVAGAAASTAFADEPGYLCGAADINFTKETEILIIGTGVSGLACGMAPVMAGKKVMFAEKKAAFGGDSNLSCWFMFAYGTTPQIEAGYTTTVEEAWEASKEANSALFAYDWWPAWVEGKTLANTSFIESAIADFGCTIQVPPTDAEMPRLASRVILPGEGIGTGYEYIMMPLQENLEAKGAEFCYEMKAQSLIKNAEGRVIGCRFTDGEGNIVDVKADAVVLATGGFIDNGEMMNKYLPGWAHYGSLVTGGSMGEGQMMAWAAGAMEDGMTTSIDAHYCNLMGDIPNATTWGYFAPLVLTLPNGKRFIQEGQSHDAAQAALDNGYNEWWVIFDQQAFDARPIAKSVKNNINIHSDAYVTADSLEELAEAMDVPADNLVATFAEYDGYVAAGVDDAFGKTAFLQSLQAPFHALRLNVRRYKTSGGLMVGGDNQVLDVNGEQIPGLYACGAVTTQAYASCSTCCATGYWCGQTLAAL